jgi:hypothetical protein
MSNQTFNWCLLFVYSILIELFCRVTLNVECTEDLFHKLKMVIRVYIPCLVSCDDMTESLFPCCDTVCFANLDCLILEHEEISTSITGSLFNEDWDGVSTKILGSSVVASLIDDWSSGFIGLRTVLGDWSSLRINLKCSISCWTGFGFD